METPGARHFVLIAVALTCSVLSGLLAPSADAAEPPPALRRIRVLPSCSDTLLADAAAVSPTLRALVARIERSDLLVYVRCMPIKQRAVAGRLLFLSAAGGHRYLMIEVRSPEPQQNQAATVAHELQHAVELAEAAWVRSDRQMAQYYRLAGAVSSTHPLTFDTEAARRAGERVQRELAAAERAAVILARRR